VKNIELLYTHIKARMDSQICLSYAKTIIACKLKNSKVMLQRRKRFYKANGNIEKICNQLDDVVFRVKNCSSLEELRGFEGIAARYYFEGFAQYITSPFTFNGRNRRPPKDPVNSMLSL
jgi:CRISPR-associated protein Cas1